MNAYNSIGKPSHHLANGAKKLALLPLALLLAASMAQGKNLRDGLVAYWPLDAHDGSTTADVAFTNTMSVVNNPAVVPGQRGNAFSFVNPTTYLTNLHSTDNTETGLPIYNAGRYTIAMWVKGAAQTARYLFAEGSTASNNPLLILQTGQAAANNNKLDVIIRTDGNATLVNHLVSTAVVFDDTWHHIAWVDDMGSVRLYVDGVLDTANFSYVRSGTFSMNTTAIGTLVRAGISTGAIFNGLIDDVAVWERALSHEEVEFVRTNGIPTPVVAMEPGLYLEPISAVKHTGDWHRFSALAYGSRPYPTTYQWNKNGLPISGANGATYFLSTSEVEALAPTDTFSVTVTNDLGGTTSSNAVLTLVPDPAPDVAEGLVDYWPLDVIQELGTNLISPEMHFGHDMVLNNFLSVDDYVSGQYSNALAFDAFSRYTYRTNGSVAYRNSGYSISLWVQGDFNFQNDRRIFSEGSNLSETPLLCFGTHSAGLDPALRVFMRNNANQVLVSANSILPVFDNAWHHVVWTDIDGQAKLYIDGVLDETDFSYPAGQTLTLNQTSLGAILRSGVGNYFAGNIDEVATWNRVLTWTEIQEIKNAGVPVPEGVVAPSIVMQPPQRTNDVYVGDNVTFPAQVDGTFPISIQWYQDGAPISTALNPSAATDTLLLSNVQLAVSNTTYYLVATNGAGSVTSQVALLYVAPWTPLTAGDVLKVDFGLTGTATTNPVQSGFYELTAPSTSVPSIGGTFDNAIRITISSTPGSTLQARDRVGTANVAQITNNPPVLTQAQIYNDFIFNNNNTAGTGLNVLIDRLAPNAPYGITIWSYDAGSGGATFGRVSDWTETSSGSPLTLTNGYAFSGGAATVPTRDFDYTIGGLFMSSPEGTLLFEGRRGSSSDGVAVFVNAIRVVAQPTGTRIARAELDGDNIRLIVEADYPGQPTGVVQNSSLTGGSWVEPAGSAVVDGYGPVTVFEIPVSATQMFYRGVSSPTW